MVGYAFLVILMQLCELIPHALATNLIWTINVQQDLDGLWMNIEISECVDGGKCALGHHEDIHTPIHHTLINKYTRLFNRVQLELPASALSISIELTILE